MTAPAILPILEKCHYCSRHVHPHEIIRIGNAERPAKICWKCWEWHQKALKMFSAQAVFACQECGVTPDELMNSSPDGNVRLRVYVKDGIYQVLCEKCGDAYERKRLDLFADTAYGQLKKLQGAK